ncbi:MAG: RluA family pseudouridine synthase [Oscillospiraceae bacterium]
MSTNSIKNVKYNENGILLNYNNSRVLDVLQSGDVLEINFKDENVNYNISNIDVPIIYEDDDYIVFNKPYNMATHPSMLHQNDTLANVFAKYINDKGQNIAFRPINRLDRDTTGLVLVAKNPHSAYMASLTMSKKYYCIINGNVKEKEGTINLPIKRCDDSIIKRCIGKSGKKSITHYKVIKDYKSYSFLEIVLETGRTHQIRVHFSHIGHSLVGDTLYGYGEENERLKRQGLHCGEITFNSLILNEKIIVKCDIFEDMKSFLETIK